MAGNALLGLDRTLYQMLNGLAGRSPAFDTLVALPLESNLVKAGVIGACFVYAWYGGADGASAARRRRILLVTAFASLLAIAATKLISTSVFLPRPYVLSQKTYQLDAGQLAEAPRLAYRVPLNERNRAEHDALRRGEIEQNDLGSFPSDHAGFFGTIAVGILMAARGAGLVALGWLVLVTLASRVITGQHSPYDIAGGALIGMAILIPLQLLARRWGRRLTEPIVAWTMRHPALSGALLFLFAFEATNALDDVRRLLDAGEAISEAAGRL
ncbi:MAG TPA: phosphatase PAP2 family protein [Allosphingosinicella sp.]|nr:phosphatase PAP2 family protein [Allosphingosinicella sp.]